MAKRDLIRHEDESTTDLSLIRQMDLLPAEKMEKLQLATADAKKLAGRTLPGMKEHLGIISQKMLITSPTTDAQMLQALGDFQEVQGKFLPDLHRYRKIYFQSKVKIAELKRLRRQAAECEDPEDREVLEAQAMLMQAEVDEMECQVSEGHDRLKELLEEASQYSDRYHQALKESGKTELTPEDIEIEEVRQLLKTALYYAGQVFVVKEVKRPYGAPPFEFVTWQQEVLVYFEAIGITRNELDQEFMALDSQRKMHYIVNPMSEGGGPVSFRPYFENWLRHTADRYLDRVKATIRTTGRRSLERIAKMLDLQAQDRGQVGPGEDQDRMSVFG